MSHPLVLYCHSQPGSYEIFHHHVEQSQLHKPVLRCTHCGREGRSVEAILTWHHLLTFPEGLQETTQPRARSIPLQCDEKAFPVHGFICLPKVQEYPEEEVLVYTGELPDKI